MGKNGENIGKPLKNLQKPPKNRHIGSFSDFQNPLFSKLAGFADKNHQNNEKPTETAQKPHKNRQKTAILAVWRFFRLS